jgi:hypothetical protein
MSGLLRTLWAAFEPRDTVEQRSMRLLRAHLNPLQRRQFDEDGWFDVVGGQSGRRYRIYQAYVTNVQEVGTDGACVQVLCFSPRGHLPLGDVLLAQKVALEVFEGDALAVACRWPASVARRYTSMRLVLRTAGSANRR